MKRIIAFLLALVLVVGYLPAAATSVYAEEAEELLPAAEEMIPEETAEETEPAVEETEPAAEETEPAVEETEPVVEETEPAAEETEPVAEETEPVVEETEPVVAETEPVAEETEPVAEETEPAAKELKPAEGLIIPENLKPYHPNDGAVHIEPAPSKLVEEEKQIRVRKEFADGTFTWETKTIIVEKFVRSRIQEFGVSDTAMKAVEQDKDDSDSYYFDNFDDLKTLVATFGGTEEYINACYRGTEPLVITEDLTLPEEIILYVYPLDAIPNASGQLEIPAGVTLNFNNKLRVNDLVVNGTLEACSLLEVYDSLKVNGQLNCYSYINLGKATADGTDKISFKEDDACVMAEVEVETVSELADAVAAMDVSDPHWYYELYWYLQEDTVLDRSVTIPSGVTTYLQSHTNALTLTIPADQTLSQEADGVLRIYTPVIVEGTLHSDSNLELHFSYSKLTVKDGATFTGSGNLFVLDRDEGSELADAICGIDLNNYLVRDYGDGNWYLENIVGKVKLAAPTDLTWNKAVKDTDEGKILVDYPGSIAWKADSPVEAYYDVVFYQEVDGEWEWLASYGIPYDPAEGSTWMSRDDLTYEELESGKYMVGIYVYPAETPSQYLASDEVMSAVYTYTKPSAQLPAPTNLKIDQMDVEGEDLFGLYWSAESGKCVVEWYYCSAPTDDVLKDYEEMTTRFSSNTKECGVATDLLNWCGKGYYYGRVRVISDNIQTTATSEWSAMCGPYYYYDAVVDGTDALLNALETANSPETARQAAQALDQDVLFNALRKDKDGTVAQRYAQLEALAGGAAKIKIADDFTAFAADQVSVVGANLNTPASAEEDIALAIGKPEKSHALTGDLNSPDAVQFSMKLENVAQQTVPVLVTLPVPAGIDLSTMVVLHHGAAGDENLQPVKVFEVSGQYYVTLLLADFSDFTITEDLFTQDEFMAEYNAALKDGEYSYTLTKPVVLTKDVTLGCDDRFFRLELGENGAITVSKGVHCKLETYLILEDESAAVTVAGTLTIPESAEDANIEVCKGTFTIAAGGKVNADYIVTYVDPDAKLNGWPDEKTVCCIDTDNIQTLRDFLDTAEKYYVVQAYLTAEDPVTLDADLTVPGNGMLIMDDVDFTIPSGVKLLISGDLNVGYSTVTVAEGASLVNNGWIYAYNSTFNAFGTYSGSGYFSSDENTFNGNFLRVEKSLPAVYPWMGTELTVAAIQENSNLEFVWTVVSGGAYVTLAAEGNTATIMGKVKGADHTITIKVATKDGSMSNTFDIPMIGKHAYVAEVIKPTYTKPGCTFYVCEDEECPAYYLDESSWVKPKGLPKPSVTASNDSKGKPVLKWKHDGEADYYYVYRATSKTGKKTYIGKTTGSSYTDSKATMGRTYYYFVKAICKNDSSLNSSYSTYDKAVCKCATPTVTVSVSSTTGKPIVKWKKITGARKYTVYRATSKSGTYRAVKTTTSLSYTDTTAKPGTTYYYKVKVIASKGTTYNSAYSSIKSAKCTPAKPVARIALSSKKPRVTWRRVSGATKYYVYRSTKSSSGYKLIKTTSALSFRDSTAKKGTTYYYKVVAGKGSAKSAYSTAVRIKSK